MSKLHLFITDCCFKAQLQGITYYYFSLLYVQFFLLKDKKTEENGEEKNPDAFNLIR